MAVTKIITCSDIHIPSLKGIDELKEILNIFIEKCKKIVKDEDDATNVRIVVLGDIFNNKPIVILIDGYSASASEVLSAALSEQNRATLIGTKTYGKGTIQEVSKNTEGGAMALTASYFYTPGGNIIDKKGLMPAICTGGLKSGQLVVDGVCDKEDRFTKEADVEIAVKYIKNEI